MQFHPVLMLLRISTWKSHRAGNFCQVTGTYAFARMLLNYRNPIRGTREERPGGGQLIHNALYLKAPLFCTTTGRRCYSL
jgi:hypothetical protein